MNRNIVQGRFYTDAQILDIRQRAFEEARTYYEKLEAVREAAVAVVNADDWRSGAEWDEALASLAEALSWVS